LSKPLKTAIPIEPLNYREAEADIDTFLQLVPQANRSAGAK